MITHGQTPPSHGARPWITAKDALWMLYLYPGRWLAMASAPMLEWCLEAAEPVIQGLAARRKSDLAGKFASSTCGRGTPDSGARAFARTFMTNAIRRSGNDLVMAADDAEMRCHAFHGREHLDEALSAGKGVLLASLHWYARRAANRYLATIGYPVMAVRNGEPWASHASRLGLKWLRPRYVRLMHQVIRDEVFIQDRECTLKILARLRRNGIVDLHMDSPFSSQLVDVPFLGKMRGFPAGPLQLARISGCAILPIFVSGHAKALRIHIDPPLRLDRSLDREAFCTAHMPGLVRILESHLKANPDQWDVWTLYDPRS